MVCVPFMSLVYPLYLQQRLGVYNQHAADQLELRETPVEYLQVRFIRYQQWFTSPTVCAICNVLKYLLFEMQIEDCSSVIRKTIILYWLYILYYCVSVSDQYHETKKCSRYS